jgi:multiple sugar transport system substrate-binding protein
MVSISSKYFDRFRNISVILGSISSVHFRLSITQIGSQLKEVKGETLDQQNTNKRLSRKATRLSVVVTAAFAGLLLSSMPAVNAAETVTVWHYFSGNPSQEKVMTDYKAIFEKANPGVTVENVYVPYDQMNSKLIAAASTKSGPDVVVFNGAETNVLADGGILASMDTYWNGFADKAQFPSSVIHKSAGKVYSAQGYVNLLGLWYNADILAKINLPVPKTIAGMERAMAAAKKAGYKGITLCGLPQGQGEWQAMPWISSTGFNYGNLDAKLLTAGLSLAKNWVDKGYLSKEATTWDQTVPFQKFLVGDTLFAENGNWQAGSAAGAKFKYGVAALPIDQKGRIYLGGEGQGIGAFSKNKDLAWSYLKSTYFSKSGQLVVVPVGSIPSRLDSAKDKLVKNNKLLKPFAAEIAQNGANYPPSEIPAAKINDAQTAGGVAWSSVIGGSDTPAKAAAKYIAAIKALQG